LNPRRGYGRKGVVDITLIMKILKGVIVLAIVCFLSLEIEEWSQAYIINQLGEGGWQIIRFVGFIILWNAVNAALDAILNRHGKRK